MSVDKTSLGPLKEIGAGAEGTVYQVKNPIPVFAGPMAYKEVRAEAHRDRIIRSMEHAVGLRAGLDPADLALLDEFATWPLAMVEDRGAASGVLMPLIPDEFFTEARPPGGTPERVVFEFAFLSSSDKYISQRGIDRRAVDDPLVRTALAGQLTFAIALLHKNGIVYGDLSLRNVAISGNPPRLKLLDCDPAALVTNRARHQLHSPFMQPPETVSESEQNLATDVYKLGLCVLRGLVTGTGVTQLKDPQALRSSLDDEGVNLIARALAGEPADRPTARELYAYFERTVRAHASPPVIHAATIDRAVRLRGQDVVLIWKVTGASSVRIVGPNGFAQDIGNPAAFPRGFTLTPTVSGEYLVEATNKHGTAVASAGVVTMYDLPPFSFGPFDLPDMRLPPLDPIQVPPALLALPAAPMVSTATHPMPRQPSFDIMPLLERLRLEGVGEPLAAIAGTTDALRSAYRFASEAIVSDVHEQIRAAIAAPLATAPPKGTP
jgi:hypothetical protein